MITRNYSLTPWVTRNLILFTVRRVQPPVNVTKERLRYVQTHDDARGVVHAPSHLPALSPACHGTVGARHVVDGDVPHARGVTMGQPPAATRHCLAAPMCS